MDIQNTKSQKEKDYIRTGITGNQSSNLTLGRTQQLKNLL